MTSAPTTPPRGSPSSEPAQDVPAVLATCRQRPLEREGIAMFVALHDARPGRSLVVHDGGALREGLRLSALFEHYHRGLRGADLPTGGEVGGVPEIDETGAGEAIEVLVVLSDQHLRAVVEAGPEPS